MSKLINSSDARLHSLNIQRMLAELHDHLQYDIALVDDVRFNVLAETVRENVKGMIKTFNDFDAGSGKVWGTGKGVETEHRK
jgi:hypothetical protein